MPYRQIGNTLADLMGGRLDCAFIDTLAAEQHIQSRALRPLGVTTPERLPGQPAVPALLERFPDFEVAGFLGFAVRSGTPAAAAAAIHRATDEATAGSRGGRASCRDGADPPRHAARRMEAYMARERERWGRHIRLARIGPE